MDEKALRLARLAGLALTEGEAELVGKHLARITKLAGALQGMNCEGLAPMASPATWPLPLAEDRVEAGLKQEEAVATSKDTASGMFRVPPLLGED